MTPNYVVVLVRKCLDVKNNGHIIKCDFGDRIMSGFEVNLYREGTSEAPQHPHCPTAPPPVV